MRNILEVLLVIILMAKSTQVLAQSEVLPETLYLGDRLEAVTPETIIDSLQAGTVVIVSEIHNLKSHHQHQAAFLEAMAQKGIAKISVGMEFLSFVGQTYIDQYLFEGLPENQFLKNVNWSGDFSPYRPLVLFPKEHHGETLGLNAPRTLTAKISKSGISSLTEEERALIPPDFTLGNPLYFERFKTVMTGGGHELPPQVIARYFEAQSVWDETMAYVASNYMEKNPDSILVIIVGDFHAQYGGGLPDRLRARGVINVVTISQVNLKDLSPSERLEEVIPHPKYGVRADFIWTTEE
ncbi:MAG: ChaN family lipoprotein [Bdellovibrio sp.]|nr:ChaN family lipoprotein [Bdellovibrio sp.]